MQMLFILSWKMHATNFAIGYQYFVKDYKIKCSVLIQ
jgi:hypothetical protein